MSHNWEGSFNYSGSYVKEELEMLVRVFSLGLYAAEYRTLLGNTGNSVTGIQQKCSAFDVLCNVHPQVQDFLKERAEVYTWA
jgi:hypothetical protein